MTKRKAEKKSIISGERGRKIDKEKQVGSFN